MADQDLDYAAIRRNVEKSVSHQKWVYRILFFVMHALFFVVAMLAVWGTIATDAQLRDVLFNQGSAVIVILPTILWAAVILFHVASLYLESSEGEKAMRERLLMREIGEDILRKGLAAEAMSEKPKRRNAVMEDQAMRLSDDGELTPVDEDERIEHGDYHARANHPGSL
jgi:hypothetical protein